MASASDAPEAEARASELNLESEFAQAVSTFKAGEFGKALSSFIALSQRTQSPNVQLYVGYCYARLGRPSDAHRAFSLALERIEAAGSAEYNATRNAAQQQLLALDAKLSKLTLSLIQPPPNAVVKLDGRALSPAQMSSRLTIEPGVHVVEADAPGTRSVVETVSLEKGGAKTVVLLLRPRNDGDAASTRSIADTSSGDSGSSHSSLTTFGWAAAGLGVVGWSVFAISGFRAKSAYESLQVQCNNPCADTTHRQNADSGKAWQTAANVGLSMGILGTLSAATLFIWGSTDNSDRRAHAAIQLGPGTAQLSYQGRF